ncbi:MAG: cytochrome P450, partial [Pseudonocardiales bacterium]|nr:cytochrome P450 [Pseudonocardiales bacterium]
GNLSDRQIATDSLKQLVAYMHQLITHKRAHPGQDVISDLIAAQADFRYGDEGIAGLAAAVLFAGHETTVTRIDFGTLLLLTHPDQYDAIRRDPELVVGAVEEILRVAVPGSGGLPRYAQDDIDLAGVTIRAGDAVLLTGAVANRDAAAFPDPDRFDITRTPNPHLILWVRSPLLCRRQPGPSRTAGRLHHPAPTFSCSPTCRPVGGAATSY